MGPPELDLVNRGRRSVALDLKNPAAVDVVRRLVAQADVLVEGFRPGVAERLGLGPEDCHAINPRLVYGRMTGWGQDGPLAQTAGHDIDYLALSGALHLIGRAGGPPQVPANLLGDFARRLALPRRSACSPRCTTPSAAVRARSSTPRSSTARRT